jgi:chromosome partitioning protein
MARHTLLARVAVLLGVWGAVIVAGQAASAQRDDERRGGRVQPPTELLEEYPFRQGELRSRERTNADRRASAPNLPLGEPVADDEAGNWVIPWLVIAAAAGILLLGVAGRRLARATAGGWRNGRTPDEAPPPRVAAEAEGSRGGGTHGGRAVEKPKNGYAVVNQKGGVGKTTVSLALGAAAVRRGSRVLLLDLDPQASATSVLAADVQSQPTMTDVMAGAGCALADAVRPTGWGLDLAPAERGLRSADSDIPHGDEAVLPRQLATLSDYDLILLDCPPNLGALTINALAASSRALVVTEPTFLALHAMEELLDTLHEVAANQNPELELAGVVLNRLEPTAEHKRSMAELADTFGSQLWEPHVPRRAILQDAMRRGVPPQDLESHSHYATEIAEIFDALAVRIENVRVKS